MILEEKYDLIVVGESLAGCEITPSNIGIKDIIGDSKA